ncbi:MAG: response regulator [Planctomycetaceae bacterium]
MSGPIRVLLVDDEPLILSSLRRLLLRDDFEVTTCASGADGVARITETVFDLVVSDYMMPAMNGLEFLEQVRQRLPRAARVLLSAQADKTLVERALDSGLLHLALRKPWENAALVAALRQVVRAVQPA